MDAASRGRLLSDQTACPAASLLCLNPLVCRGGGAFLTPAPPSSHTSDVSGRASAVKTTRVARIVDCRRHAAAGETCVSGWCKALLPPQVDDYEPLTQYQHDLHAEP